MVIGPVCQNPRIFTMLEVPVGVEVEAKRGGYLEFFDYGGIQKFFWHSPKWRGKIEIFDVFLRLRLRGLLCAGNQS
jgi:hypothetical protein